MALSDDFDVRALELANREILELEAAAIARARLHIELEGGPFESFHNENGFSVQVNRNSLLADNSKEVVFYQRDAQGDGQTQTVTVPVEIIFGELTEDERDYAEYKRLKAKFDK